MFVTLKPSVFDPQGRTIAESLHTMGYGRVGDVRQGKYFELDVDADSAESARATADEVSRRLLANPVIESYKVEIRTDTMKFAVVVFPGSNCDHDAYHAAKHVLGQDAEFVWHKDTSLGGADVVILPGGFAHGDYLRTGAIARFSPVMDAVAAFAGAGGPVLGICNGFQVLLEAGLLDGAMLRNRDRYRCEHLHVRVERTDTPFTRLCSAGDAAPPPDRARRGQLLRAAGRARSARAQRSDRLPLRGRRRRADGRRQPERLAAEHRRHLQSPPATSSD